MLFKQESDSVPEDVVHALNVQQCNAGDALPTHPYTCGNRSDGKHGRHGGDLGLLIATPSGWQCPWCDYRQPMRSVFISEPYRPSEAENDMMAIYRVMTLASVEDLDRLIAEFRELVEEGRSVAAYMVESLERRRARKVEEGTTAEGAKGA